MSTVDLEAVKAKQQTVWASGDFAEIATTIVPAAERLVDAADLHAGWSVLDVATGSGNAAIAAARLGCRATGSDYVPALLERGRERARAERLTIDFVEGDAESLPFGDASFDAVTVGFGIRNVDDLEAGLHELRRVLRPGGRLGVLEITRPRGPLRVFYSFWFDRIVPLLGRVLPGGAAYTYLPASVRRVPGPDELKALLERVGFGEVEVRLFAGGIVALHTGVAT